MTPENTLLGASNRRSFLIKSGSVAAAVAMAPLARPVHAAGSDGLKLALVGCGGRGAGAANQALSADPGVRLVAMADIFPNRLETSLSALRVQHPQQVEVPDTAKFTGFDGYQHAIAAADVVILATPPGFRPAYFEEAVRQGKHVFMEKPLAVDAPGVRRVLAAAEEAKKKRLKVGVGFQRRHQPGYLEALERVRNGDIGDITSMSVYWLGNARAGLEREPGETEMGYQLRNWYFFTWLSGDHNVEQHCHNIDVACWFKGGHPVRAQGMGGRQVRNGKQHGYIFDHHFVEYEFADGTRLYSQCRQNPTTLSRVSERIEGSKGILDTQRGFTITGANPWRHAAARKAKQDAYQLEHDDLFAAIRKDADYNEAEPCAISTMVAIMGRMATYSGKMVEWDDAFNSKLDLGPKQIAWDAEPPILPGPDGFYPVAMPGRTVAL
jgi:myo-inositol 2-dehydrogenase / D-chiro-inositol 1-dehydrogenase